MLCFGVYSASCQKKLCFLCGVDLGVYYDRMRRQDRISKNSCSYLFGLSSNGIIKIDSNYIFSIMLAFFLYLHLDNEYTSNRFACISFSCAGVSLCNDS